MFDLNACHVERNEQQDYVLHWRNAKPGQHVRVYLSDDPNRFYHSDDWGSPLIETREQSLLIPNPDKEVRHYFALASHQGEIAILAERKLQLQGAANFRDLGGYETSGGRKLKWGKLYRSSKLSELSGQDINYVNRLGLTVICDFRQLLEQEMEPSQLGENNRAIINSLPITPGSSSSFLENLQNGIIAVEDAAGLMQDMNRDFVVNQMPQYAEMFQLLLAGDQQFLIHCASGKDRTGFGSALILDVLGVGQDKIIDDYLLTNQYLPIDAEIEKLSQTFTDSTGAPVSHQVLRPLLEVRPEYLLACFDEIKQRFESKEHFFETALKLDKAKIEQLKKRYLHG